MEVTGGMIRTDKTWWYFIDYVWKYGVWIAQDPERNVDLVATDTKGYKVSLKRLRCDEVSEMLGI